MIGKWLRVTCLDELKDRAILETADCGYILADDAGYFSVGDTRGESKESKH